MPSKPDLYGTETYTYWGTNHVAGANVSEAGCTDTSEACAAGCRSPTDICSVTPAVGCESSTTEKLNTWGVLSATLRGAGETVKPGESSSVTAADRTTDPKDVNVGATWYGQLEARARVSDTTKFVTLYWCAVGRVVVDRADTAEETMDCWNVAAVSLLSVV